MLGVSIPAFAWLVAQAGASPRSSTVTSQPRPARNQALHTPCRPEPITTTRTIDSDEMSLTVARDERPHVLHPHRDSTALARRAADHPRLEHRAVRLGPARVAGEAALGQLAQVD